MKKIVLSFLLITGMLQACKDRHIASTEVPATVTGSFNVAYPNAKDVKWEKEVTENQTIFYKAKFKSNGVKATAKYNSNGVAVTD